LASDFLSDIELYFSLYVTDSTVSVVGEECHHIMKVMRHTAGDKLFVTNGNGKIFETEIMSTTKNEVKAKIVKTFEYKNRLENFIICLPRLRVADRFEFALEKCVELGFTNFVVFESERTVAKGDKSDRWKKIGMAAMKQSLQSYLPKFTYLKKFEQLNQLKGKKLIFDQNSDYLFSDNIQKFSKDESYILIFGPEGGLSEQETELLSGIETYRLTPNRLRAETAVIAAVSLISLNLA
jgi:16S rRNA (uracil1498-N3)-methyltransferase